MMTRRDREFRFHLKIGNATLAVFSEVSVEIPIEAIDYREDADVVRARKLPGMRKFTNITMKRGMTTSDELSKWYDDIRHDAARRQRRNVVISVLDEGGKAETARFVITDAWPAKYDPSDLNAKGNEVIIELLELANEGIERIK